MKKYKSIIILLIVINIIFTLVIFNLLNITNVRREKQIIKEMTQSELERSLNDTIQQLNVTQEEYAANVDTYKKKVTEAITNQGVTTQMNASADVVAENIEKIVTAKTTATATEADIVDGKTAWVNGVKITGTRASESIEKYTLVFSKDGKGTTGGTSDTIYCYLSNYTDDYASLTSEDIILDVLNSTIKYFNLSGSSTMSYYTKSYNSSNGLLTLSVKETDGTTGGFGFYGNSASIPCYIIK